MIILLIAAICWGGMFYLLGMAAEAHRTKEQRQRAVRAEQQLEAARKGLDLDDRRTPPATWSSAQELLPPAPLSLSARHNTRAVRRLESNGVMPRDHSTHAAG